MAHWRHFHQVCESQAFYEQGYILSGSMQQCRCFSFMVAMTIIEVKVCMCDLITSKVCNHQHHRSLFLFPTVFAVLRFHWIVSLFGTCWREFGGWLKHKLIYKMLCPSKQRRSFRDIRPASKIPTQVVIYSKTVCKWWTKHLLLFRLIFVCVLDPQPCCR